MDSEKQEIKQKLKSNNTLMSNIRFQDFQGFNFYHTICSKAKWEQRGNDYQSPQQKAFDKCQDGDILLCIKNEKGSSYGSMPFEDLEQIYKNNHYLYEILREERKFYLDIEFPYIDDKEAAHKLALIWRLVSQSFMDCGIKTKYKSNRDFFSKSIGIGEQGGFKDIKKFSAHMVFNNGAYFKSTFDINKFARYMKQTINNNEEFKDLIFETDTARDYAIDFGVYTKNRLFKLPYQSKPKSTRIQTPATKTPTSLESCLISNITEKKVLVDVSKLELKTEQKSYSVKNKAGKVIGSKISNNVAEFLEDFKSCLPDVCPIPEGSPDSGSLEYVVKSIYNGKSVEWSVFCAVGMAIKRASGGNAFELWVKWASKSGKPQSVSDMRGLWGRFSVDKGYGFSTLLNMAKLCNPELISQPAYKTLFNMPHIENKKVINKRYLEVEDFNLKKSIISYIKSPMGTGKSFNIHKIQKRYKKIIYLSSKRAFAVAMGKEFEEDGFKNYIDLSVNERYDCEKLIISLESFHQINPENIDLLIVDESESIFNVIGSHTLQAKGEGLNNLIMFEKAIRTAKKVLVMDAFLSNRSFNAVKTIRPDATSALTINEWKPTQRKAVRCLTKDALWFRLKQCLENKERCVVVSGSKKFAIQLFHNAINSNLIDGELDTDGIYHGKQGRLYHSGNPLDLGTKVNEEWKTTDLLIYSPTITCGISYDNPDFKFDRLFVYMPNKFSACFRDATQALKRVREFTKDTIYYCLSTKGNYNFDMSPIYFDKIKELIYTWKPEIFTDEKHFISLQTTTNAEYAPLKNWVSEARIYNILEQNLSGIFIEDVCREYFNLENIKTSHKELAPEGFDMEGYIERDYSFKAVQKLNCNMYDINEKEERGERLTREEYWYKIYDNFLRSLKMDTSERMQERYWNIYMLESETRSQYFSTIKFNKLIKNKAIEDIYEKTDSKKILEINSFHDERYSHLYKMFKQIKVITEDNKLNLDQEFLKEDLEPLLQDYETLRINGGLKAFNQLLKYNNIREWSDKDEKIVKETAMDTDKMYIMLKHLANDLLGLETGRIKQKKKRVLIDGVKKQKFFGVFKFASKTCTDVIFNKETKQLEAGEEFILDVLKVAYEEPEIKPSDWFTDSGITSQDED